MPSKPRTPSDCRKGESMKTAKKKKKVKDKNNKTRDTFEEDADDHKKKPKKGKKDKGELSRDDDEPRKKHTKGDKKRQSKEEDDKPKKKKKKERTVELDTEGVPTTQIVGPTYRKSKAIKKESNSDKEKKAPSIAKEVSESEHPNKKSKLLQTTPSPLPASPGAEEKAKDKKSDEKMPPSDDKDKEQKVKTVIQQAPAAPNIIILNYGGKDVGSGGKMVATNQGGNIILRPEGAPAGAALDAAIAAATGQQPDKIGAAADTFKNPNQEENLKKVPKFDPNYMTLAACGNNDQVFGTDKFNGGKKPDADENMKKVPKFDPNYMTLAACGNNDQVFGADKFSKESKDGGAASTDSNAPKPSTDASASGSPVTPVPAPAAPVPAFAPTSPEKVSSAYATPGGNPVGGAVSVFAADGAQTGGSSGGSLTPAPIPIGVPTPAVPATYTQSSGGKGAQSTYLN